MKQVIGFIKANKLAVLIILITIVIAIGIVVYFNNKESDTKPAQNVFPLKNGSRGAEVEILQNFLNSNGEALIIDGIFGARTEEAVKRKFSGKSEVNIEDFNKIVLAK